MTAPACIIYCRVSTDEQARGYSLPTQEESCRRYSADRGYTVLSVFTDAHSGTELDRPGLNAAIEAVATLKPEIVLLHDVDRLGRELIVQAIAERELTRYGARVEFVLGGNTDSADGILLKGVKQALAVYENYQRVERSRRGKNGRVQAGGVLVAARPAYGYRYVAGERTGTLEPDPVEAPILRRIFAMCADEGMTCYAIAKYLSLSGIPSRADTNPRVVAKRAEHAFWDPSTVAKMLGNETYTGTWYWGKKRVVKRGEKRVSVPRPREEWLSVPVPALVDGATWQRAQEQLQRNKQTARRNARRDYLLRGLVFCPSCGRRWTGRYKNHLDRAYYRCPTTEGEPWRTDCSARFGVEQQRLERHVLAAVQDFLLDPATRAAGVAAEHARHQHERDHLAGALADAERRLTGIDHRLGALLDETINAGYPDEMLTRRKRELLAERERCLRDRDQAASRIAAAGEPDIEIAIADLAPIAERAFATGTPSDLRRLLELLRVEVHVIDRDTVRITGIVGGPGGSTVALSPG